MGGRRSDGRDGDKVGRESEAMGVCHGLECLGDGVGVVERLAHTLFVVFSDVSVEKEVGEK